MWYDEWEQLQEELWKIKKYAHRYWNFDEQPPEEYKDAVAKYICNHIREFKGAVPHFRRYN